MYKILLVEDDSVIAGEIQRALEAWGYETACVTDFRQVLADFAAVSPHLVILDISLPFFNGYHWCQEIRKLSKVPILFLSSASDNMNIVMAMQMGGDDFIAKPFDRDVLTAKVQALLRRAYDFGGKTDFIEHRGAILNRDDATLSYNGADCGPDQKRLPHFADIAGKQGEDCQPRHSDDSTVGNRQLCG